MKLYIDTSKSENIVVALDDNRYETDSRKEKSQKLLPFIDEILGKMGKSVNDITEIQVNTGPGSYTGLRVGVSVANALGYVLKVPVNGKDVLSETVEINYD